MLLLREKTKMPRKHSPESRTLYKALNPSNELQLSVEQMYIATGFVTLVHSYIQVTARSIDYILFIRALGVSMWKQSWLKCFNLNIPLFLIQTNFTKEIKKRC